MNTNPVGNSRMMAHVAFPWRVAPLFVAFGFVLAMLAVLAVLAGRALAGAPPGFANASHFPGAVWKDRLAEDGFWDKRGWQRDGTTVSIPKDEAFCPFPEKLTDAAIRVRFRYDGPGGSFIDLILRSDGGAAKVRYVATTFIGKEEDHRASVSVRYQDPQGNHGPIGGKGQLARLKPGDEHTLEFYAKGDHLAYYFDGQLAVTIHDTKLADGQTCLFTGSQVHFLSVETAEFPKTLPLAGAPATPPSKPAGSSLPLATPGVAATRTTPTPVRPAPPPQRPSNTPPSVAMLPVTPPPVTPRGLPPGFSESPGNPTPAGRAVTAPGATPAPTADDFRNVPTVDPFQFAKNSFAYEGKIVKLKFTARVYDLTHENGRSRGQVGVRDGRNWYNLTVFFPSDKDEWFMKFSNNVSGPYYVYARMSSGDPLHTATILGREVRSGPNGPEFDW